MLTGPLSLKSLAMRDQVSFVRAARRPNLLERRNIAAVGLLASLALFVVVSLTAFSSSPSAAVVLPLEVLGPDGHTVSAVVNVSDPSGVTKLWVKGMAMDFVYSTQTKASVRVNGGSWIPVDNSRATCEYPESDYGCIGSNIGTIRFTLPISGIVQGVNQIDFRFNGTDGMSAGYRVLDFNLVRSNGTKVLPPSTFQNDDPSAWTAPRPAAADIAEGKRLWEEATLIGSPLPNAGLMRAACADCHERGGKDLKYFAYSNKSIVARSVFHGLSQADGERIASYIRSLNVEAHGRPWNPPYQPGPGLDSKPVEEWSAGAGLEWVLDDDKDMIPYVFPDANRKLVASTRSTLNMREIPIAFQLPNWNQWLPRVHPLDGYGPQFANSEGYKVFSEEIPAAMQGYPQSKSIQDTRIADLLQRANHYTQNFARPWTEATTRAQVDADVSLQQWQIVKMWEFAQEYKIEDVVDEIYPVDAKGREHGEVRGWPGMAMFAFLIAPHMVHRDQADGLGPYRDQWSNKYFSTAWYQLQMTVNPGFRESTASRPIDWKYHLPHIDNVDEHFQVDQTMRHLTAYMKSLQIFDNADGAGESTGWHWRDITPAYLWYQEVGYGTNRGALNRTEFKDVIEPVLDAWITKTEEFSPNDWCRGEAPFCLSPTSFDPRTVRDGYFLVNQEYATQMYRLIPEFDRIGVDPAILSRMADWAQVAWPKVDWHSLYSGGNDGGNSAPTVSLSSPANNSSFEVGSSIVMKATAADADGSVARVEFWLGNNRLSTDTSAPYEYTWVPSSAGSYSVTARATDDKGLTTTSTARTVTITGASLPQSSQSINLKQGWNLVSSWVQPASPGMSAVFDAIKSEILLVKDEAGRQYHPPSGLNTIGNWTASAAYEVYANSPQTLRLSGYEVSASQSLALAAGWNHLSFPRRSSIPIVDALAGLGGKVNIVKDVSGKVYYPAYSINEIGSLQPGQGYKIHLSADGQLTYPSASGKDGEDIQTKVVSQASSAVLVVEAGGVADGTLVSVESHDGTAVGDGVVQNGIALIHLRGDDPFTTASVEGVEEGQVLTLTFANADGTRLDGVDVEEVRSGLDGSLSPDGMIRYSTDAVIIAKIAELPGQSSLEQNFPNPFQNETSIRYSLPEDGHVRLDVYNVAGQHVAVLVDETQNAGWHTVAFDARDRASGLYLYRLVTDDTITHKQMLLRK